MKSKYCATLNIDGEVYFVREITWNKVNDKEIFNVSSGLSHHFILTKSFKSAKKWASRQNAIDSVTYYHSYDNYKTVDVKIRSEVIFEDKTDIFNDLFDEAIDFYTKNPKYKTKIYGESDSFKLSTKKNRLKKRRKVCNIETNVKMEILFTNERKLKLLCLR